MSLWVQNSLIARSTYRQKNCVHSVRRFLGAGGSVREVFGLTYIVGQDPSDSKSNQLHVDIFQVCCFHSVEVYSIDSSKMSGNSPEVFNFNQLNLKVNRFICD